MGAPKNGEFIDQRAIAAAYKLDERYASRILPAAFLGPGIVEIILSGTLDPRLTLDALLGDVPLDWQRSATAKGE